MASSATPASVGHRPVATTNAKKIEVSGELTTGSTLQIADVFIRDEDGDPLSLDKMNNADDIKWYLVDNEAADPSGTPAATGTAFTIPADAGGKKIKIVYRIKTATGTPDSAFLPATVLLTSASSGVSGDSAADGTLSRNPRAAGADLVWNPVPLLEVRAGYRDAGNGGSQAEGGLRVNYSFGTPLHEQLDYRNVGAPSNTTNRRAFVDRNYDIVMAYREQASKIRITAMPVSGLSGTLVTLMATVDSRYPIEKVEWSGDAELLAGLQLQGSLGSGLILPQLPLTVTDGQEYSLYLTVTDSRGTRVTSERIPVRVTQDETSFRSWINVINDDVQVEDGNFVISTPLPAGEEGKVIEWHYVRERSEEEWASLKPRHIKYQSDMPGLAFKALGGTERDGHWVERVLVTHIGDDTRSLKLHIEASGPDDKHPVKGTVLLQAQPDSIAQKVTSVEVLFTPGTEEANGSVTAPVVGTEMRARTLCVNNTDCTDAFNYQWEISDEMKSWQSVPGATKATWLIPYSLNGESLQNKYIRVRIISDKENAKSSTAASDAN